MFCHLPVAVRSVQVGCDSWAICCSSSGFLYAKAGQLGQILWSGRCPLELRSRQTHFYVCPKPRFQLGERLWNLFPKALPTLCSPFFTPSLHRDDCLMLLIMLDPLYFRTPVRNSDHGWSRSLARETASLSEWENPGNLTSYCGRGLSGAGGRRTVSLELELTLLCVKASLALGLGRGL